MRFVLVVGTTKTAAIDGISAAGEDSELRAHTPAADAEIVEFGRTVRARRLPVSPTGCPTPAVVTRAVRELLEFDLLVVDAGLEVPTDAPTKSVNAKPGGDIRDPTPVPTAEAAFTAARTLGRTLSDQALVVGESIPGGTTTASGVLRALGEPFGVSSSLPENPTALKRNVVAQGLAASGLDEGDAAADPVRAVRLMGDPVLAATMGLAVGAVEAGSVVTLAGGTQMVAAGALIRHAGCDGPLELATTSYVAADDAVDLETAADALDLDLVVTDPGFDQSDHQGLARYGCGEAKEGVGMGGALALADRDNVSMSDVRERSKRVNDAAVEADGP